MRRTVQPPCGTRLSKVAYDENVFINCPFDGEYQPLFRALVFAVQICGFVPRSAL